jgi:hypothetical protein
MKKIKVKILDGKLDVTLPNEMCFDDYSGDDNVTLDSSELCERVHKAIAEAFDLGVKVGLKNKGK